MLLQELMFEDLLVNHLHWVGAIMELAFIKLQMQGQRGPLYFLHYPKTEFVYQQLLLIKIMVQYMQ